MKHFILTIMALMCLGCNGQPTTPANIPDMEYGDCEPTEPEINYIIFNFNHIIDFNYEVETGIYTIAYDDADVFDYENLAYLSGKDEWYGDFIITYISESDFFELLEDINKTPEEKREIIQKGKWQLREVATPVEGGMNYQYYLVKRNN